MKCNIQIFFVILDHFLPFYSPNLKNQNFGKLKKTPVHIIILHMCTIIINDNHMMHSSWDMKHDRQNFLSFWTVFLPFYPPNNPKNQNFEKVKKTPQDIIILHTCTINDNQMMYGSWNIECNRFFCHFGLFFALLPS